MKRRRAACWLAAVCVTGLLAHLPVLSSGFTFDDRFVVMAVRDDGQRNPMVAELRPLGDYFGTNYWHGTDATDVLYRPVTILSYALVYAVAGRHAAGEQGEALAQHLVNLALHVLAVWLVYRLLRLVSPHRGPPLLAALAFALHAIHSEVVANVVGRAELLGFVFGATAVLLHARAWRHRGWARGLRLAGAALALFLAFGSKENALAWAPFLFVVELARTFGDEPSTALWPVTMRQIRRVLGLVTAPLAFFLLLRALMIAGLADAAAPPMPGTDVGVWFRPTAVMVWGVGLWKMLWPFDLACDWGPAVFEPVRELVDLRFLAAAAALGGLFAVGLVRARRDPLLFLAMASFLGFGLMTSNVVIRIGTNFAERLYYAPSLGVAFALAWVASKLPRAARLAAGAPLAIWLAAMAVLSWQRSELWRSNATLFGHDVRTQPRSGRIQHNWAKVLEQRNTPGDQAAARSHLQAAVDLDPRFAAAWLDLGVFHLRAGRNESAERCFRVGLTASDTSSDTRLRLHINYGVVLARRDSEAAMRQLRECLREDPSGFGRHLEEVVDHFAPRVGAPAVRALLDDAERAGTRAAWSWLRGRLAYGIGDHARAEHELRRFVAVLPDDPRAWKARVMLASSLANLDRLDEARTLVREVLGTPGITAEVREQARKLLAALGG